MQTFTSHSQKRIIRSAYSHHLPVQLTCPEQPYGRTKQAFKDECDINTIISRFLKTGLLDFTAKNEPRYGDATGIEYTRAMQTVASAQTLFNELPAKLRARFENQPALFLDFVQNPANKAEARTLGLLKPEAPLAPVLKPEAPLAPVAGTPLAASPAGVQPAAPVAP